MRAVEPELTDSVREAVEALLPERVDHPHRPSPSPASPTRVWRVGGVGGSG